MPPDPSDEVDAAPGGGDQPDATPGGNPGAPDATPGTGGDPTFTADIYAILQPAGMGCVNCHQSAGIASFLVMNDGEQATYDRLKARAGVINLGSPDTSLILTKPLTGSGVSHPAKLFASTSDANYQKILTWIVAGAPL